MPNNSVDKVSKELLACYPRRTKFYSLSDDFSTQYHRITITDFRPCLICQSYSQASNYYYYALQLLFKQFELTLNVRLRYSLGGDRPSQTTYYALFWLMSNKKFEEWYFTYVFIICQSKYRIATSHLY